MLKKIILGLAVVGLSQAAVVTAQVPELPEACNSLMPIGKSIIYKGCAGSGHLSKDPRGAGTALIAKKGVSLRPLRCMRMYGTPTEANPEGKLVGSLYLYPFNDPSAYAWRGYSNYASGCGRGETRKKIRDRADGLPIFIKVTNNKCIKIEKAYSNKNSAQSCPRNGN